MASSSSEDELKCEPMRKKNKRAEHSSSEVGKKKVLLDVLQIVSKDLCYKNVVNERFQVLLVCLTKGLGILAVKMINFH